MNQGPNSISYEEWITERLQDSNELELYLNAVLEVFQEDRNVDTLKFALNCVRRALAAHPSCSSTDIQKD